MVRVLKNFLFGFLIICITFVLSPINLEAASTWKTMTANVRHVDPAEAVIITESPGVEPGSFLVIRLKINSDTKLMGLGSLFQLKKGDQIQADLFQETGGLFVAKRLRLLSPSENAPNESADKNQYKNPSDSLF